MYMVIQRITTTITNPVTNEVFSHYWAYNCGLTGTINMTNLSTWGGSFDVSGNSGLTAISNPTTSQSITLYDAESCGLTGTLNISGLTGLENTFDASGNSGLTGINFPASSGSISNIKMDLCTLGYVDMTGLTISSAATINAENNGKTAAEVNQELVDLDATMPNSGSGFITYSGTNAAPDGTSGGYDGTTAKSNLIAEGYTVTTS